VTLPALLLLLAGTLGIVPGAGEGVAPRDPAASHDLHVAYGDFAVEGTVVAGRVRLFKDDLERALGALVGADALSLGPGPEADALVLRYLNRHVRIEVAGEVPEASLLAAGEDRIDREPVWWVALQWKLPEAAVDFRVRNTLLFELFDDQRNVMKFVHFPDQTPRTFFFAPGESEHRVRFDRQ
jgi:hypothetical protein